MSFQSFRKHKCARFSCTMYLFLRFFFFLFPRQEFAKLAVSLSGRFTGNPSKLLGPDADEPEEEEAVEEEVDDESGGGASAAASRSPKRVRFSEAHRLMEVIARIETDCNLVPVGAFVVTPTHQIVRDSSFGGLSASEANQLERYAHFRKPLHPSRRAILSRVCMHEDLWSFFFL